MKRIIILLTLFVAVLNASAQEGYGFIDDGPFTLNHPNVVAAEPSNDMLSEWKWLYSKDYQIISNSYPVEEYYYKYDAHPHYKVKRLGTDKVVYDGESVVYIEFVDEDNIKNLTNENAFFNKIVRQLCIYDFRQNKYDIQNATPAQVGMIEQILVEGKDEGDRLERSYSRYVHDPYFWSPLSSKREHEDCRKIMTRLKQLQDDNVYTTAKRYIKQLYKDWTDVSFIGKRLDGLNFVIIPNGKDVGVKISMSVNNKKIEYSYSIIPVN